MCDPESGTDTESTLKASDPTKGTSEVAAPTAANATPVAGGHVKPNDAKGTQD